MPSPAGCGHYSPNRDYAGDSLAIKAEREAKAAEIKETLAEIEERLGKLCDLCGERNLDTRSFGTPLPYYACSDISLCEATRRANLKASNYKEM